MEIPKSHSKSDWDRYYNARAEARKRDRRETIEDTLAAVFMVLCGFAMFWVLSAW
jgi:hypothetical protein